MREQFHGQLERLGSQLAAMCVMAADAMRWATQALVDADLATAERVLSHDKALDKARDQCQQDAQALLALQAPVARDLRIVVAAVYCAEKIERMGDLASHVAAVARQTHPQPAVPAPLTGLFVELGALTVAMAEQLQRLITDGTGNAFRELNEADEHVDDLHRRLMGHIVGDDWPYGIPAATNLALLGRFYERFADQTVSTGRRLDFGLTGQIPD